MDKKKANEIFGKLKTVITSPLCELNYSSVFELLIAVMLSAQCTDKRVNIVTKDLFQIYKTPYDFASCNLSELERIIKPCGFYKMKALHIKNACEKIVKEYNGQVPNTMEELIKLDGVGRKTASVVLAVGYGIPAIPVDTHVQRVSNRIGLCETERVEDTEKALKQLYDDKDWIDLHHVILLYGRYYCMARNPQCSTCVLSDICKFDKKR